MTNEQQLNNQSINKFKLKIEELSHNTEDYMSFSLLEHDSEGLLLHPINKNLQFEAKVANPSESDFKGNLKLELDFETFVKFMTTIETNMNYFSSHYSFMRDNKMFLLKNCSKNGDYDDLCQELINKNDGLKFKNQFLEKKYSICSKRAEKLELRIEKLQEKVTMLKIENNKVKEL